MGNTETIYKHFVSSPFTREPNGNKKDFYPPNDWQNKGSTLKQLDKTCKYISGVLADNIVCIDVDDKQKADNLLKFVKAKNYKCRVTESAHGIHIYFLQSTNNPIIGTSIKNVMLNCGEAGGIDVLIAPHLDIIKENGIYRNKLLDSSELEELPLPLQIFSTNTDTIKKYNFNGLKDGDGRNNLISSYKMALLNVSKDTNFIFDCIGYINNYLLADKYTDIRKKFKITKGELNKIDKEEAREVKRQARENKNRAKGRDDYARLLVEKYKIKKLNGDSEQMFLIYPNKTYYEQVDFKGNKDVFNDLVMETPHNEYLDFVETKDEKEIKNLIDRYAGRISGNDLDKYINVNNGYINVDTLQFTPIDRDTAIITRHRIDVDYNPNAYDKNVDDFLDDVTLYNKKLRLVLEEIVGQCLIPRYEMQKFIVLVGNGSNGKSTYTNAIGELIGDKNKTSMKLEYMLGKEFAIHDLNGKLANFGDDIDKDLIVNQAMLKSLTGGSPITADVKNRSSIEFTNYATLIFSCNEVPKFRNSNKALEDRLYIVPFYQKYHRNNSTFGKKLSTETAKEYLFNLGLQGIVRTRKQMDFTEVKDIEREREDYLLECDPIRLFIKEVYNDDKQQLFIDSFSDIWEQYLIFFKDHYGVDTKISKHQFGLKMALEINAETKRKQTRIGEKVAYRFIPAEKIEYKILKNKYCPEEEEVEDKQEEVEDKQEEVDSTENDLIVYDFEVFKEDWIFGYLKNNKYSSIVNNREELEHFYNHNKKATWIGYNSNHYDIYILKGILNNFNPFEISQYIVNSKDVPVYKKFNFIDNLNELKSYDCGVKNGGILVGLKQLESNMGDSIEESEVDFNIDRKLTDAEISDVIKYNKHDVEETWKVFQKTKDTYNANKSIIDTFKLPQTDIKKTQAQLSAKVLNCQQPYEERTDSENISILDTIKIDKNKDVVKWYLDKKWTEKGAQLVKIINNVPHTFGIGGLHGAIETTIHEKGNILHIDVNSYYPSLMIKYNLLTRNSKQPNIYKEIYEKRLELKRQGKKKEQAPYKIILNATYGITKDKFSDAYDPRQGNMICINGQLALLDLIEKLENKCELIQSNTDGLIVSYKDNEEEIKSICKEWEDRLGITLGYDYIEEIWQKDANNYMIKYKNGEIECKGIDLADSTLQKNDAWIVKKAVREYLLNGTPVEETIGNVNNKLIDYQYTANFGKTYDACYYGDKKLNTKINRIFASSNDKDPTIYKLKNSKKEKADLTYCKLDIEGEAPNGAEKIANIPTHCFIDNGDINNKERTPNIDLNWYIKKAKEIIGRYDNKN